MIRVTRRLIRFAGWLLTPLVAWAASFLGGWLGTVIASGVTSPRLGLVLVVAGSVLGALLGTFTWAWSLRWSARQVVTFRRRRQRETIRHRYEALHPHHADEETGREGEAAPPGPSAG